MATRSALSQLSLTAIRSMKSTRVANRYFSDGKGRVLSEEERAAENVYIQAWPLISPFPITLPLSYCYHVLFGCWESAGKRKESLFWRLTELVKCFVVFVIASVCLFRRCTKTKEIVFWWSIELKKCLVVFVLASACLLRRCRKVEEIVCS